MNQNTFPAPSGPDDPQSPHRAASPSPPSGPDDPFGLSQSQPAAPPAPLGAPPAPPVQAASVTLLPGYKPSGKIGPLAIPLLLATLALAPPLLAFAYNATNHFGLGFLRSMWMLLIGAALLGAACGAALLPAVHVGKIRSLPLAVVAGLLAGGVAYPLAFAAEAWSARPQIVAALTPGVASSGGVSEEQARAQIEESLSPLTTARIYWEATSQSGLNVSKRGVSTNIGGGLYVALKAIEWLLCVIAAILVAYFAAARRYSEEANRWFVSKTVYSVLPGAVPALITAGSAGRWDEFRQVAQSSRNSNPEYKDFKPPVVIHYVPEKPGGILEIRAVADPKKPLGTVFERELSHEEAKAVWPDFPMPNPGSAS